MNIPADYPSPDQENVYYSVTALLAEFAKYFNSKNTKNLRPILEEFFYPTFVFDDSNAPSSYQLDVYPREGSKTTILLSSTGSILSENRNEQPSVTPPNERSLNDDAHSIELDSTFYSTAKLKSSDFFTTLEEDFETIQGADLLLGTKFWYDSNFASQRLQFLEISKNIVKSALKNMPKQELKNLKTQYNNMAKQIDDTIKVLSDIKQGQALSLDAVKYENLISDSYNITTPIQESYSGLAGTNVNVAQSILDLARSNPNNSNDRAKIRKGKIKTTGTYEEKVELTGSTSIGNGYGPYQRAWSMILHNLKDKGHISKSELEKATETMVTPLRISEFPPEISNVLKFSFNGSEAKNVFDESGWLKNWYYDNFAKKILDEDPDFSALDEFSNQFSSLSEEATALSDQAILGGGFVLVNQAIMKAILKLCQNGMDVSEYAPMWKGETIFAKMGRSASLGPSGCHQFPSKYVHDEMDYPINPFTKTGFLCYHSIICILRSIFENSSSSDWVKSNMTKFDSDHDKAIKLWDAISDFGKGWHQSHAKQMSTAEKSYTSRNATLKKILHLYSINEQFTHTDIYLVGAGDDRVPASQRTFTQWNIPCIDHHIEGVVLEGGGTVSDGEVKPYHKDNEHAVNSMGWIQVNEADIAYQRMGWMSTAASASTTVSGVGGSLTFKRIQRVHYGWHNDNWGEEEKKRNTWSFWKQKNWNMPYFWASIMSLCKGIVLETGRNILESIKEITGADFELSPEEIMEILPMWAIWKSIEITQQKLRTMNGLFLKSYVGADGNISFCEAKESPLGTRIWNPEYRNTSGGRTKDLIINYIKFISLCSEKNSVQVVEDNEEISFDYATYLPPEVLAEDSNANFKNGHGGFSNYVSVDFNPYYDALTFRKIEFIDKTPIKKNITPVGRENEFLSLYQSYLNISSTLWGHVNMHSKVVQSLAKFKSFIEGFKINDNALSVFTEGHFDAERDIQNPEALIKQIRNNTNIYEPDSQGIRNDWNFIKLNTIENLKEEILYVYVLGLEKTLWPSTDSVINVVPEYHGSFAGVEIQNAAHAFGYYKPANIASFENGLLKSSELISKDVIDYLHIVRGIDCSEPTFSLKTDLVYSESIINSESNTFPWISDDFEEGEPIKKIDTLFNMSPWVFPRNYFYDVCLENEYQRVVGVVLKRSHLVGMPIDTLDPERKLDEIIGSIRWIVKGA